MKKRPFIPTEAKDYSPVFFIVCIITILSFLWAVWDEIETRRPWKSLQRQFREIEYSIVSQQLEEAEKNIVAKIKEEADPAGNGAAESLSQLKSALGSRLEELTGDEGYRTYQKEIKRLERELSYIDQDFRFTRSEADELFYKWKAALHSGEDFEPYEREWNERRSRLAEFERQMVEIKDRESALDREYLAHSEEIRFLQKTLREIDSFEKNAEDRREAVGDRKPEIHQVVLNAFDKGNFGNPVDRVDRCITCHLAIDKAEFVDQPQPFRSHPDSDFWFSNHPPERMGCTPCHRGQGPALQSAFFAHGYRTSSENGDRPGDPEREYLEHWAEPMFEGDLIEASCSLCHQTFEIQSAEVLNRAKLLFTELGCHACHFTKGYEEKAKIGPDLTRIRSKVYPEWLTAWLGNPKHYLQKTRMPNYRFSEEQVLAIAAYLYQNSEPYPLPPVTTRQGSIERGQTLVKSRGCRGCHSIEQHEAGGYLAPMGYDLVPDLSRIGEKVDREWLIDWMLDPKAFRPATKMPNLKLTAEEASDIAAYLLSSSRRSGDSGIGEKLQDVSLAPAGRKLIYDNGCYSCHDIRGFEEASRIAPPLSDFGNKDPKMELYFGDAPIRPEFRLMYGSEAETWENWTFNKLKNPRIYEDEVTESKMPAFDLSDENARSLVVLLRSFNGKLAPEEYRRVLTEHERKVENGKNLVRTLNCVGCHPIDGKGGDIRKFYEDTALAPPDLTGEGDKVQADWLFEFLKKPAVLRPWLTIRMPDFGLTDQQASVIVEYFNSLSRRKIPFSFFDVEAVSAQSKGAGRDLLGIPGTPGFDSSLKCGSCHPRGRILPEGNPSDWGPDLFLARKRLKPEWFADWLRNPQAIQPGTRMPNFFYDYEEFEGEIEVTELLPEPEAKISALKDYILSEGY